MQISLIVVYELQLERMRPEFRAGLDALTKFVFERTKPKQLGSTVMTGPILAGLTQSFLDAINSGAVPTISSSWQVKTTNQTKVLHCVLRYKKVPSLIVSLSHNFLRFDEKL